MHIDSPPAVPSAADASTSRPDLTAAYYHEERYLGEPTRNSALTVFYALKPLLPRRLQLSLRRLYARRQAQRQFPAWPIEPLLVDQMAMDVRAALARSQTDRLAVVGLWPQPWLSAAILTHDVEGPLGIEQIDAVLEIEQQHGLRSAWNFVAEDYPIPPGTFARLREAGCEIGLHGIHHDGKLFQSRARFEEALPKVRDYLARWDAVGFRSPATHRNSDWMHELGCLYDSSYPDTDPFEPQPGGCCSIHPFMFGDVVELPLTLVQDHTLWEILRQPSNALWTRKCDWITKHHGLININIHPDYLTCRDRLDRYERFVADLAGRPDCWHALPREVAWWWKARVQVCGDRLATPAPADLPPDLPIWWARTQDEQIIMEL